MITRKSELARHELIGLKCKITRATNPSLIGLEGIVVDETKHMLVLSSGIREKKIPKREVVLKFGEIEIDGKKLVGRPEDRVKLR
jgi:ribonuclease P protein subunit POP4